MFLRPVGHQFPATEIQWVPSEDLLFFKIQIVGMCHVGWALGTPRVHFLTFRCTSGTAYYS